MDEIWKPVKDYEGFYEVSNLGRVRSTERTVTVYRNGKTYKWHFHQRILKQYADTSGYMTVDLHKQDGGCQPKVHRLVAEAFIPNPYKYPCINHKDEGRIDNRVENLEWCTYKYNNNYGTRPKRIGNKNTNNPLHCRVVILSNIKTGEKSIFNSVKDAAKFLGGDSMKGAISS